MNLLDRVIGYFAPEAAYKRSCYRSAIGMRGEKFGYEGAKTGRRTDGWHSGAGDANTEVGASLVLLRDRSRDLIRNNPYASKAIEELVGNTVGTGIVPKAETGDEKINAVIDAEWPYFAEACDPERQLDFYGMQGLMVRTTAESGDGVTRFRPRRPQDNLRIPLQLQVLEGDFLDISRTMGTDNGGHIIQGVEFDQIGQRVAYWLYNYHPGGVYMLNPQGGILSRQTPASEVMHMYRVLRPGQVRGVPHLANVMLALRDIDDYRDAERMRKKTEACLAGIVTRTNGPNGLPIGQRQTDEKTGNTLERMYPGMIEYLKPGEDIKFNSPPPAGGYREYLMTELEGASAGVCMPFELMSGNMSNVNYSSYRAGLLGFRNTIEAFRWLTLMHQFCQPTWRRFIDTLVLLGKIPEPNYGVQWTAPKFESVDPVKDAEATLKQIRMGTLLLTEAIAQNGYDPSQQLKAIGAINALLDEFGIILDSDPRNMTLRGQEQSSATGEVKSDPTPTPRRKLSGKLAIEPDGSGVCTFNAIPRWDSPARIYRS